MLTGWVVAYVAEATVAHYWPTPDAPYCKDGHHQDRAWTPWQDAGRIPLCEKCRFEIRFEHFLADLHDLGVVQSARNEAKERFVSLREVFAGDCAPAVRRVRQHLVRLMDGRRVPHARIGELLDLLPFDIKLVLNKRRSKRIRAGARV